MFRRPGWVTGPESYHADVARLARRNGRSIERPFVVSGGDVALRRVPEETLPAMALLKRLFGSGSSSGLDVAELARRLDVAESDLRRVKPAYRSFAIPKRNGGFRKIDAPSPELKAMQRKIHRRLLAALSAHPAATGFERGHSIASNAAFHVGQAVVVRMDIIQFFQSTARRRVRAYFETIGWNAEASELLCQLCTHRGGLPQGAPTSPRLSNLVNRDLDASLQALADKLGFRYSRYADDMTFSAPEVDREKVRPLLGIAQHILWDFGYDLHMKRKLHIRQRHQQQIVTGLVVNERLNLPRKTRRRLRAIEHHLATGRPATLMPHQLDGWHALQHMIAMQREASEPRGR